MWSKCACISPHIPLCGCMYLVSHYIVRACVLPLTLHCVVDNFYKASFKPALEVLIVKSCWCLSIIKILMLSVSLKFHFFFQLLAQCHLFRLIFDKHRMVGFVWNKNLFRLYMEKNHLQTCFYCIIVQMLNAVLYLIWQKQLLDYINHALRYIF